MVTLALYFPSSYLILRFFQVEPSNISISISSSTLMASESSITTALEGTPKSNDNSSATTRDLVNDILEIRFSSSFIELSYILSIFEIFILSSISIVVYDYDLSYS